MPVIFVKQPSPDKKEAPADKLYRLIGEAGLPLPDYCKQRGGELVIAKLIRRWQADMAWVHPIGVLVEIHGGVWDTRRGRHLRPLGFTDNCEKRNAANLLGWRVYEFTPEHVENGYAIALLTVALDVLNRERPQTSNIRRFSRIITDLTHLKGTTQSKRKPNK